VTAPEKYAPPDRSQLCPTCGDIDSIPVFTATDRLYRTTDKPFQIVRCASCRLLRLFPQPSTAELAGYYPRAYWYGAEDAFTSRMEEVYRRFVLADHVRFVRRAIESSGGTHGLILDVGCGGGLFLRLLSENGYRVTGLDLSANALAVAVHSNGVAAVCGDLSRAPFTSGSCSVITMFHVLEHLHDPGSYLMSSHKLLSPGGRLVVQVPNASSWQFRLLGKNWTGIDVPRHLVNFRAIDLETLLERHGFEVVRRKHFSLRDNPAGLATSVAPMLDPMARRVRGKRESSMERLFKDAFYFVLVVASVPWTLLEAACRAGSTVMMEARKKA
jgi:SAM-dependent methyltransferase